LISATRVPELRFGPNAIRNFTAEELDDLLDPDGLSRKRPGWRFDSQRFSRFAWLVVEEIVVLPGKSSGRVLPGLFPDLRQDFGRIEPHKRHFPAPVEAALFALLTAPWEEVTSYSDLDWRPFRVPWVHTLSDDLFARRATPPDADTLSWEPDFYEDEDGAMEEIERPARLPLTDAAIPKQPIWMIQPGLNSRKLGVPAISSPDRALRDPGVRERWDRRISRACHRDRGSAGTTNRP
jgi:hypothetical protein